MTISMKKTIKYFMAALAFSAAALVSGPAATAQDGSVKFDKQVSPTPNDDGVYTITLEAYVTGSVTVTTTTKPADIVLVLDYSGSMTKNFAGSNTSVGTNQRIYALRNAVKDFVDKVKLSDGDIASENIDSYGGHRIAFILYGGNGVFSDSGLNTFIKVEDLTTGNSSASNAGSVTYNSTNLIGKSTQSGGTPSDEAMEEANTLLSKQDYVNTAPNRSRVVVFFTDGIPGEGGTETWNNDRREVANGCINAANTIKNAENYSATIYSVGLFNAQANANETTTYLSYTSSDFKDKTSLPSSSSNWVNVSGDKSIIVNNSAQLSNVFSSIATSTGGDYDAASSSSVLVDIVTNSFTISEDTDLGTIKVYQVPCTQASKTSIISWASRSDWTEITDDVDLVSDPETGEVTVSNFDYGANWCGWDESTNSAHGNKLVLEIPITINEDAVGGPSVATNVAGSKLIIRDSEGNTISEYDFPIPHLKIPVNIWIQKQGLTGDDSAVFTLYRAPFVEEVSNPESLDWQNFTKVIINKDNMDENGIVKIAGLDPDYYYKIKEDAWGWGYSYQSGDIQYTVGDNVQNPFVVVNVPKEDIVKHDEAVVRNVFKKKEKESSTTTE